MRKIIALLMLLLLLTPPAHAAEAPYPRSTVLSAVELTASQRKLADFLYPRIFRGDTCIELPKNTAYSDVSPAMHSLMQDYPELFHLDKNYSVGYYQNTPQTASWLEPRYRMGSAEASSLRARLYVEAKSLADGLRQPEALHDALCSRVAYGGRTDMRHTAVGALLEGQATCEGYAQALTLLYRMAGYPCGVISGQAVDSSGRTEGHSWNIAYLNGYTLIDATWNDQDNLGINTHWYYGLSTAQMGTDHFPDADAVLPFCGEQDNWHTVRGYTVSSQAGIDAALRRLAAGETVNLRFTDWRLYHPLASNAHDCLTDYNERNPAQAFYGSYSITKSETQLCLLLQPGQ